MSFSPDDYKKNKAALETQKAEAEMAFDGEQVGKIDKALEDLEAAKAAFESKSETEGNPTEGQVKQVENLGGNMNKVNEEITEKTEEMKEIKNETSEQVAQSDKGIKEVEPKAAGKMELIKTPKSVEEIPAYLESLKQRNEELDSQIEVIFQNSLSEFSEEEKKKAFTARKYNHVLSLLEKPGASESDIVNKEFSEAVEHHLKRREMMFKDLSNLDTDSFDKILQEKGLGGVEELEDEINKIRDSAGKMQEIRRIERMKATDPEAGRNASEEYLYAYTKAKDGGTVDRLNVLKDMVSLGLAKQDQYDSERQAYIDGELGKYSSKAIAEHKDQILKDLTRRLQ